MQPTPAQVGSRGLVREIPEVLLAAVRVASHVHRAWQGVHTMNDLPASSAPLRIA